MTETDLCVNKPHCAAFVRPWESEATTSTLPPARVRGVRWGLTCASKCLSIMVTKKNQSRSYLNHHVLYNIYNLLFIRFAVITHNWIVIRHPVTIIFMDCCKHGNENSVSIKSWKFLGHWRVCWLLRNPDVWRYLHRYIKTGLQRNRKWSEFFLWTQTPFHTGT